MSVIPRVAGTVSFAFPFQPSIGVIELISVYMCSERWSNHFCIFLGTSIHAIRPTRNQRPKSAKHGVRSSTSGVNNVQRQTCAPNPESRLKQEETLQGRANRPKSAKNRSRDQNTELNTNPLHSEQDLLLSRPKSAKHGRRAGTRQMVVTNGIDGFHGNGRDDDRTGNGNRMDETKDAETPRSLCRPKSAGLRQGHPDQHVFSNGMYIGNSGGLSSFVANFCLGTVACNGFVVGTHGNFFPNLPIRQQIKKKRVGGLQLQQTDSENQEMYLTKNGPVFWLFECFTRGHSPS